LGGKLQVEEKPKEKVFRFIIPIEILPPKIRERDNFYEQIINEFISSGLKYASMKDINKKPLTIAYGLRSVLKRRGLKNIKIYKINNQIYLKKLG